MADAESDSDEGDDDEDDESDDSEDEGAENENRSGVMKSSSSAQLQSMLKSILSSRNELSIGTFKVSFPICRVRVNFLCLRIRWVRPRAQGCKGT